MLKHEAQTQSFAALLMLTKCTPLYRNAKNSFAHTITVQQGFEIHRLNDLHQLTMCLCADFGKQTSYRSQEEQCAWP